MQLGSKIGAYVIEAELGRGGMGVVLKAHHPTHGVVALKVLLEGVNATAKQRKRFLREGTLGGVLTGEGIVRTLETGEANGLLYIAFEFVDGGTLGDAFEHLDLDGVVARLAEVSEALAVGHAKGIVHRDLKPDNIMIRHNGRAAVADFGLVRDLRGLSPSLTRTGGMVGTPAYMPPEQIQGTNLTPAADVFALGVILYEGLTGEQPFMGGSVALRFATIHGGADPPSALNPDVSRALDAVCLRAIHAEPEQRYPDAGALAADLRRHLDGTLTAPPRLSRPLAAAALGGTILAVVVAVAVGLLAAGPSARPPEPPSPAPPARNANAEYATLLAEGDALAQLAKATAFAQAFPKDPRGPALLRTLRPWTHVGTLPIPKGRDGNRSAFAYDPNSKRLLLFGGWDGRTETNQLLVYDGSAWTDHSPTPRPPPRYGHAGAFDVGRGRLVVFGGRSAQFPRFADVWEWDGSKWHWPLPLGANPARRCWHAMAYDPKRRVVVLFGGDGGRTTGPLGDLWEWDGKTWTERTTGHDSPAPRMSCGIAWDSTREVVVIFGGRARDRKTLGDLWEWNGRRWEQRALEGERPAARYAHGLVHDGERLVLFGGRDRKRHYADMWSLTGDRWEQHRPVVRPPEIAWHAMAYDPSRARLVLTGGYAAKYGRRTEVWELPTR